MFTINYIDADGKRFEVVAKPGETLMAIAVKNDIRGIDAICGGQCACATCHVHLDEKTLASLGPAGAVEAELISFLETARANSRLSCQIKFTEALDGIFIEVARVIPPEISWVHK